MTSDVPSIEWSGLFEKLRLLKDASGMYALPLYVEIIHELNDAARLYADKAPGCSGNIGEATAIARELSDMMSNMAAFAAEHTTSLAIRLWNVQ